MKSVLISIRPEWCEKIARGQKTVEIRKTRPKMETPFKCYIYCTKDAKMQWWTGPRYSYVDDHSHNAFDKCGNGKVIGEFVCDAILRHCEMANADIAEVQGLVRREKIFEYAGGKEAFGWHISDLKIYDRPLELRQFVVEGDCDCLNCRKCYWSNPGNGYNVEDDCDLVYEFLGTGLSVKPLFRPPQSWCYVERYDNGNG